MSSDMGSLRQQIMANATILFKPTTKTAATTSDNVAGNLDVVVFGQTGSFTAAVMVGLTPAIEGAEAARPEVAMNKLLLATCELLNTYIPKVLPHQRNIHGGGVFDEALISGAVVEAQKNNN